MVSDEELKTATVMVVDDDPANVQLLERMLAKAGYSNIVSEMSAPAVLEQFRMVRPDLVLLDLHMPERHGLQVLQDLRAEPGGSRLTPVIVLTADTAPEVRLRALVAGATDFLTKPFDRVEVMLRVRNLLEFRFLQQRLERTSEDQAAQVRERTTGMADQKVRTQDALVAAPPAVEVAEHFLGMLSRELRTPITALTGALRSLPAALSDPMPPRGERLLEIATVNATRLQEAIEDVLLLQQLRAGDLAVECGPVSLTELLETVQRELAPTAGAKGLELRTRVPSQIEPLHTDPELLHAALTRLVENGIRFTEAGVVQIAVEAVPSGEPVTITVSDTGPGVAAAHPPAIVEPFHQADKGDNRVAGGLGLGLSIARGLCGALGFTLRVGDSDQGAVFVIGLQNGAGAP